ncbi:EAL domain-containing protein [Hydrogenophaga aquatica]
MPKKTSWGVLFCTLFWVFCAQAQDKVTLQLKWHHQFQFAGYYAAKALGYYADEGLDVRIKPVDLNVNPAEEVLGGRADFGVASTDLLLMRGRKEPVVVLASVFQHSPYVLLAMRRDGIESVHDLVGKKVMIDPFATEVLAYLRTMGVPLDQVQLVQANDYTYEDLVNGRADAYAGYITNDPYYLEKVGASFLSFLPRSAGIDFYGDNLYTTESQLKERPDRVAAFRRASLRGWQYAVNNPGATIDLMVRNGWGQDKDREKLAFEAEKVVQMVRADLVEIGYMHEARWRHVLNIYADLGMLPRDLSLDGFLYGQQKPLLPLWAFWVVGVSLFVALALGGFAWYVHRAKQRLEVQVAQRKRAEDAELKLAGAVYQSLGDALLLTDEQQRIVSANPAFVQMTGYQASELIGRHPGMLLSESDSVDLMEKIQRGLLEAGQWSGELGLVGKDGVSSLRHLFMKVIKDEQGAPLRHVCIFSALENDKSKDDSLWNSIHLDPVTGLPNRKLFLQNLQEFVEQGPAGSHGSFYVLMLDIDRFQEVNEVLGHHVGDQVLVGTAQRLRGCLGPQAFLARLGGDEFAIVMPSPHNPSLLEVTVQQILTVMTEPFHSATLPFYLSASIGIANYPKDTNSPQRLLELSEQAMYVAKEAGRNRRVYFSASMQEAALERLRMTNDLRRAIQGGELFLEYQPIVCLRTGAIHKTEALMRWHHPAEGLISPARFIPLAEKSGLIVSMGRWAFQEACRQLAVWHQEHPLQLSINKSPIEFQHNGQTVMDDLAFMRSMGLPGEAVAVEITEGLLLDTSGFVGETLRAMRESGIQLSLDDFGTGYSSMAYLQKMDIGFVKIDKIFVQNLENDLANRTLCGAIVMMAHGLGIKVIAEGVETAAQASVLAELGCDFGQGFYFAKPLPPEAFDRLLGRGLEVTWAVPEPAERFRDKEAAVPFANHLNPSYSVSV